MVEKITTKRKSYKPKLAHFRLITLFTYLVIIFVFNAFFAPLLGLSAKAEASSIDPHELVNLANQDRSSAGLSSLTVDQRLINAATSKAINMFHEQYWSHYGPNGETPWQFINGAGYQYTYAGENLAKDFTNTSDVNTAWMNSASHKANILNSNYKNVGIAAISGKQICNGTYPDFTANTLSSCINTIIVVQMFGTLANAPTVAQNNNLSTPYATPMPIIKPVVTSTVIAPKIAPVAPSNPVITYPINNSIFNSSNVEIKGNSDNGTSVNVYEGDKKLGSISANGGAFDIKNIIFNDGDHVIKAQATKLDNTNPLLSGFSSDVKISVLTQKPIFDVTHVKLQLNDKSLNEYYVEGVFNTNTIAVKAVSGQNTVNLDKHDNNMFSGYIKIPITSVGIVLSAFDIAGNEYDAPVSLVSTPISQNLSLITSSNSNTTAPVDLSSRQIVNAIIGFALLIVFATDSFLVWRSSRNLKINLIHNEKIKGSFFHHIIPMVFVLFSLLITVGGNVL